MSAATYATFNTFTGCSGSGPTCTAANKFNGITTKWKKDYPDDIDANFGFRYKGNLENGLNYSVNYFYHYGANPDINLSWHDPTTGEKLNVQRAAAGAGGIPNLATNLGENLNGITDFGVPGNQTTVLLRNSAGAYYGAFDPTVMNGTKGLGAPELRFTESLHRIHSIGTSFDYALDTAFAPIVLRGEFLYDKDDTQAIVDKRLLAIGDLSNALKMEDADYFKYVLGVDVTVLKNLLVSGQFIQFRNLDYRDKNRTCQTQPGIDLNTNMPASAQQSFDCSAYTGDLTTLSLSNGMKKAYKNKEFYSMFLSKPFGPSDEHRWNNIVMYEEGGGYWNRLDMEYSFSDNLIGTAEWNQYWGDEDTQFGQFKDSSNVQVGLRYLFD